MAYAPAVLVDSCILIDILANDPLWADWSLDQLDTYGQQTELIINPIILAEVSPRFETAADLEAVLEKLPLKREQLPWDAAFMAGQVFKLYRKAFDQKRSPMPDFYIGAHAMLNGYQLLTRDQARYKTYFPKLPLICP